MKNKKKLGLTKMSIAQLNGVVGGEIGNPVNPTRPVYTVISYVNCGNQTQIDCANNTGLACQYSAAADCQGGIDMER